uniref:Uncharacterized protein n=1 Tax=Arion vulgaris TaxID=1028688 RepID=A0A0B6ZPB3_9EUPU
MDTILGQMRHETNELWELSACMDMHYVVNKCVEYHQGLFKDNSLMDSRWKGMR